MTSSDFVWPYQDQYKLGFQLIITCVFDYRHYTYMNGNDFYSVQSVVEFRISGIIILKDKARKSRSDSHGSVNLPMFTLRVGTLYY